MKRLLITLVILTGLIGAGGAVWAQDFDKGLEAYNSGDYATALKEWRSIAEQGNAAAQFNLGLMYGKGEGVTQDYATAVKWFRKAAEQGIAHAQHNLGFMYDKGNGVTQDYGTAAKWYRKAAEQGFAEAQGALGALYFLGYGVIEDHVIAHMWINIAAASGQKAAADLRGSFEQSMTAAQIAEAQKLARECVHKKYKGCGF